MRRLFLLLIAAVLCIFLFSGCILTENSDSFESNTNDTVVLITIIAVIAIIIAIIYFAQWLSQFERELRHINNEIGRNDGKEKEYWIKKRRRLWLSIIPFIKY